MSTRKERIEVLRDSDDRVTAALWEENSLSVYGRAETIHERADYAKRLREEN